MDKSHSNSEMPLNASNTVSPVKHQTAVQGIVLETPDKPVAPPAAKKIRVPVVVHPPNGTNYSLPENVMPIHTAFSVIMVAASSMPMKGTRGAALSVLLTELKRIGPHITVGDLQDVAIQNCIKVTDDLLLKLAQACMKLSTIGQHNMMDAFFYARDEIPVFRDMASALIQKTCVGRNLTDHRQRLSKQQAIELFLMGYRGVLPSSTSGFKHLVENADFTENADLKELPPAWLRHNPYDIDKNSTPIDLVALEKDFLQPIDVPNIVPSDDNLPAAPAAGRSPEQDSMMTESNM